MPLSTDFIINIDLLRDGWRKEGKGLCVFLDQWTLSLAFKQNIHIEKLTNVVSSIGVVTQNISISALQWISRLRSEVLEWRGLTLSDGTLCLIPLSHFNWGNCSGAVLSISSSQMKAWRHYQYPILHFDTGQMCNPGHGYMQSTVKLLKYPNDLNCSYMRL